MLSPCFCLYILFVFASDTFLPLTSLIVFWRSHHRIALLPRRRNRLTQVAQSIFVPRYCCRTYGIHHEAIPNHLNRILAMSSQVTGLEQIASSTRFSSDAACTTRNSFDFIRRDENVPGLRCCWEHRRNFGRRSLCDVSAS
jgi:hypothetical protein